MYIRRDLREALAAGRRIDTRLYFGHVGHCGRLYAEGISDPVVNGQNHAEWRQLLPQLRAVMGSADYRKIEEAVAVATYMDNYQSMQQGGNER